MIIFGSTEAVGTSICRYFVPSSFEIFSLDEGIAEDEASVHWSHVVLGEPLDAMIYYNINPNDVAMLYSTATGPVFLSHQNTGLPFVRLFRPCFPLTKSATLDLFFRRPWTSVVSGHTDTKVSVDLVERNGRHSDIAQGGQ